jgi:hypothetical protein
MYLAGMAGTGKSQVLKALIKYFKDREESHRLLLVAPTGSAAAQLGGSTYHSLFGISDFNERSASNLSQVRNRLIGVNYIFLDEVSMLSCHDLYRISCQLSLALNILDQPFGGINMLFAGDFAQLPPVVGGENSALYSQKVGLIATYQRAQEEAMGKALWHQVTTVIILRKNMRQQQQTKEDIMFQTALENMRYKACTSKDINFLQTRISSCLPGEPSICDFNFRNASIITALNVHKDEINKLGAERFAAETGQQLTYFYSDDFQKQNLGKSKANTLNVSRITDELQNILWNQPPSATDKQIPGKLSLCKGMPIMIRYNGATELCITKGQEGIVYGWQSTKGSHGQLILDTLFVKLRNPPSNIQFNGLPENVVPLYKTTTTVYCTLPDDSKICIQRNQIEAIHNFSMTDFASQGKTRQYNPVDLNNCRSHQSYYTALSRATTAAGTLIIQGFHPQKVMGGASGALHQEFREIELLDEITTLKYNGKLNKNVIGDQRNMLIAAFRKWKGLHYVPSLVHSAIRWNSKDLFLESEIEDLKWNIIKKQKMHKKENKEVKKASPSTIQSPLLISSISDGFKSLKRKLSIIEDNNAKKKPKIKKSLSNNQEEITVQISNPIGTTWSNNSCAYDSIFCILFALWKSNTTYWTTVFCNINSEFFSPICTGFLDVIEDNNTLENIRDDFRQSIHSLRIEGLLWGRYASVVHLIQVLFTTPQITISSQLTCSQNHAVTGNRHQYINLYSCMLSAGTNTYRSISEWIQNYSEDSRHQCNTCGSHLTRQYYFVNVPEIVIFDFAGHELNIDKEIELLDKNNQAYIKKLQGIIYYGEQHYTSCIVFNNQFWFHDGIATGANMIYEGELHSINNNIFYCRGKQAHVAVYA